METVTVNAEALRKVLNALIGPPHYIRELQATRDNPPLFMGNPIDQLIDDYNSAVEEVTETPNAKVSGGGTPSAGLPG